MISHLQTFFRESQPFIALVELIEQDDLGRQVGGVIGVPVQITEAELAVLSAITKRASDAQGAVIETAKADVAAGRKPETLCADLVPQPEESAAP